MEKTLNVEIVTPASVVYKGSATSVSLPGTKSPFQVLYNHAAIVSTLDEGKIKINSTDGEKVFVTSTGFAEVNNNTVSVLVETAEEAN